MGLRFRLLACLLLVAILSPAGFNLSIPVVRAQGTMIQLGLPVTGTLSLPNPEDWWGVTFPRGEVNITLTIPKGNTADLAFSFSPFQAGAPLGENYPFFANVVHNFPPGNQTIQFVAPSTANLPLSFPFIVPGPTAIRVYSPTSNYGKTGSVTYTLKVMQLQQFTPITVGSLNSFNNVPAGTPLLYAVNAPNAGAYNVTMHANATASSLFFTATAYESDFFLPMSVNNLLGQSSLLLVLSTVTTYLIVTPNLNPGPSSKPLKGNVTVSYQPMTTISPGVTIAGTFSGPPAFYLANLAVGNYYNLTLTPGSTITGRLDVYSPSWPGASNVGIASSASPGNGVVQKVRNLVVFYLSSYSFSNSSGYLPVAGPTVSGPRPDKILIRVSGSGPGSYALRLDSTPFPSLSPNTPASLRLSTVKGPFYSFYQAQSGPGAYTESFPYKVTNSTVIWSSEIDLDGATQMLGTFDSAQILRNIDSFLLGPASRAQVLAWQAIWERNFITNNFFLAQNTTIRVGYGTTFSTAPYVGVTVGPLSSGNSTYTGNLSYSFNAPTSIGIGTSTTDFLSGVNVKLYTVQLSAGSTYRLDASHVSASEVWALYDPTSYLTVPTLGPFLIPGVSTDPNQLQTSGYFYFTAPATGTYYLAAGINPGPVASGPTLIQPEEQYSFIVTLVNSPPPPPTQLSVTLSTPSQTSSGQTITINGTVTNTGSSTANNVVVTITLPTQLTTAQSLSTTVGTLAAGQSASFKWTLTASGSGTATAAIITTSDNAPQMVKTSTVNISATNPSPSFFATTTGAAVLAGTIAAIAAFAVGLVVGKTRKQKLTGAPQSTQN